VWGCVGWGQHAAWASWGHSGGSSRGRGGGGGVSGRRRRGALEAGVREAVRPSPALAPSPLCLCSSLPALARPPSSSHPFAASPRSPLCQPWPFAVLRRSACLRRRGPLTALPRLPAAPEDSSRVGVSRQEERQVAGWVSREGGGKGRDGDRGKGRGRGGGDSEAQRSANMQARGQRCRDTDT
jgi:hypothetical protein